MQTVTDTRTERLAAYRALLTEFALMGQGAGLKITPFRGDGYLYFSDMPEHLQDALMAGFGSYVGVCREVLSEGGSLRDDQILLWRMFQKLKVHPPSDLMSQIGDGNVIEIYNGEFVQVFRNFNFFELCSYTLDDLLCRPFFQLFKREEWVTQKLMEVGFLFFSNQISGVYPWNTGEHTILEIDSDERLLSVIENRIAAPLFNAAGQVEAVVNVIRCKSSTSTKKSQ